MDQKSFTVSYCVDTDSLSRVYSTDYVKLNSDDLDCETQDSPPCDSELD